MRANGDREVWLSGPGRPPKLRLRFFIVKSELRRQHSAAMASECLKSCATMEEVQIFCDEGDPRRERSHVLSSEFPTRIQQRFDS